MSLLFYIAHTTHGRTRIRWADDEEQKHRVAEIAAELEQIDGIITAAPRLATGSIIIEHPEIEWVEISPLIEKQAGLEFCPAPQPPTRNGLQSLNTGLGKVDGMLRKESQNAMDLKSFTVMAMLMLAIIQALRGQVMVSAASFLWFALNVAMLSPSKPSDTGEIAPEE
jgi:hypothetical protein